MSKKKDLEGAMLHIGHNGNQFDASFMGDTKLLAEVFHHIIDEAQYEDCAQTTLALATEILIGVARADKENDGQIIKLIKAFKKEDELMEE